MALAKAVGPNTKYPPKGPADKPQQAVSHIPFPTSMVLLWSIEMGMGYRGGFAKWSIDFWR